MVHTHICRTLSFILLFPFFVNGVYATEKAFENKPIFEQVGLRVYCKVGSVFGSETSKCFTFAGEQKTTSIWTEENIQALITQKVNQALLGFRNTTSQSASDTRVIERVIERPIEITRTIIQPIETIVVTNTIQQVASPSTSFSSQAFQNIQTPFWSGGGSSVSPTIIPSLLAWSLTGNTGTNSNTNFLGTTDAQDLVFRTNNATTGLISADGTRIAFGIGSQAPAIGAIAMGQNAGQGSTGSFFSHFFGFQAGQGATNANNSNFFGTNTGQGATNIISSNFFGEGAGSSSTNTSNSNFFGSFAGLQAGNASHSNFFGTSAGSQAGNANNSIFIGKFAGLLDTVDNTTSINDSSILIGSDTNTGGFSNSIGLGFGAINTATNQFMIGPSYTQFNMRGVNYTMPSLQGGAGTVLGNDGSGTLSWVAAGVGGSATPPTNGLSLLPAGIGLGGTLSEPTTINTNNNIFSIDTAPIAYSPAHNARFVMGTVPRLLAGTLTLTDPFIGAMASSTTGSSYSYAGLVTSPTSATRVGGGSTSYFDANTLTVGTLGENAGNMISTRINNANHGPVLSNIMYQGTTTLTVLRRTFFQALDDGRANIRSTRRIGGITYGSDFELEPNGGSFWSVSTSTSSVRPRVDLRPATGLQFSNNAGANYFFPLTNGASGTVMTMGTGGQLNFGSIPSLIANAGNISIGTPSPLARLHVFEPSTNPVARFENTNGYCEIHPTTTSLVCTSDKTLKKDITEIPNTLSLFSQLRPVTYHWNTQSDTDPFSYGLIAQEVEALYPTLVFTNPSTNIKTLSYGSLLPITIQAIKDLNTALGDVTSTSTTAETFSTSLIFKKILGGFEWMGVKISNGLAEFKTVKTEKLCVGNTCVTEAQLVILLQNAGTIKEDIPKTESSVTENSNGTPTTPDMAGNTSGSDGGGIEPVKDKSVDQEDIPETTPESIQGEAIKPVAESLI